MARCIPDSGLRSAPIVIIGESPGKQEYIYGAPFIGASGMKLAEWLEGIGLTRDDCYITNAYPYYPREMGYKATGDVPTEELREFAANLHDRLACLTGVRVIVPMGNFGLNALMHWTPKGANITKYRGSVLSYTAYGADHDVMYTAPVVPTFHPAFLIRGAADKERACLMDWQKVRRILAGEDVSPPEMLHHIWDPVEILQPELDRQMSVDIETIPGKDIITCVGIAQHPARSRVVPTWWPDWEDETTLEHAWDQVRTWCESPCEKIVQSSGFYDAYWLRMVKGIKLVNAKWNTYWMHHCLDPGSSGGAGDAKAAPGHSLAFLASMYTNYPYWKEERKDPDRQVQLEYNGKDNIIQYELFLALHAELVRTGKLWQYEQYYLALAEPLFETMCHGIRVDTEARKKQLKETRARVKDIGMTLENIAGYPLSGPKAMSPKKVMQFLYDDCGLPPETKYDKGEKKNTTDEVACRKLLLGRGKDHPKASLALPLIIEHRQLQKRVGTFLHDKVEDKDGRARTDYKLVPETGRISSGLNPRGRGLNLQNVPPECRGIFTADEGCVLLEVDLSTAEDRVVKMLTRDPKLMELARTHPSEFDQHRSNAALMFGRTYIDEASPTDVTKTDRDLAKRTTHGSNYNMQGKTMSETWLKDGIIRTTKECTRLKELYIEKAMPLLPEWHKSIRAEIMRYRQLTNTWGCTIDLSYARLDDETYRRGYAFKPQSEVGRLLNNWGFIPMYHWLKDERPTMRSHLNLQIHDSLVVSCPPENVWDVARQAQRFLERPRKYYGQELTIPCTFGVGYRWGAKHEFKKLPDKDTLIDVAKECARENW